MTSPFRNDLLADKVALITGGGSGICFEIAKAFTEHGGKVAIMGRREDVLKQAAQDLGGAGYFAGDVRKPEDCQAAIRYTVETFERLDILLNGAAGNFLCPPEMLSPNGFKTVVDIDLLGTFNMCHAGFTALKENGGVILNISATLHYQGTPNQIHVSAAKAGVDAVTVNLATEWGPLGIRVVGIAPGMIGDTEGMKRLGQGLEEKLVQGVPLRRMGTKTDIAHAALYLASEAGEYITGETLVVDGGEWLFKAPWVPRDMVEKLLKKR